MIALKNIHVAFGNKVILNDLLCTTNKGDFITIVGPNGAGKSVLLDTIAGTVLPRSGSISFDGADITHRDERQRSGFISRIFQNPMLNCVGTMTVAQNLSMAVLNPKRCGLTPCMNNLSQKALATLEHLNLTKHLHTPMNKLSGGQRQTISFVMATLIPPKLLLLDEPTAALDPASATELLAFAVSYIKTHTITTLLITHDPYMAINLGNKLWILEKGGIAKEFSHADEKRNLSPQDLIGHIDYERIKAINVNS